MNRTDETEMTDDAEWTLKFIMAFRRASAEAHATARKKGWYEQRDRLLAAASEGEPSDLAFAKTALMGLSLSLIHSEISEALESVRHGGAPDDKIPEFSGVEAELADVIIRIMDTAACEGLRVAEAVIAKMEMNRGREYRHGGKLA